MLEMLNPVPVPILLKVYSGDGAGWGRTRGVISIMRMQNAA